MTVAHVRTRQKKTSGRNDERDGRPSQTDVIFVVMDALGNVFVGEVLILHGHENGHLIAVRIFHALNLSRSNQTMFSNQNAHAFRSNSSVAKMGPGDGSIIVFLDFLLLGFLELGLPFFGCSCTVVLERSRTNGHEDGKVP